MSEAEKTLLIKRYASRRLYNTETSDYVTLEDIAGFIRTGREVQIIDLKSGDDLTRQYLLQIIAERESRGDNVLPVNVLMDLVRSYTNQAGSVVPDFLSASFEMLRESQTKVMGGFPSPLAGIPGLDALKAQQEAFLKTMTGGWTAPTSEQPASKDTASSDSDLADIKKQLAELQSKLSKMS
ncbi:polyhydroxyalkanoate synthesis repressor PhaR [Falsihalocynthiibacter sp. S25ZX9]|uniref:Polyhydroxyalkanoate biosynthesis repressor PhaR n=1 Tax=Falsihalocynthiibacter arcticus TaxID=1579316 RepID=A0A126UV65_9RHOB|nr:polyhydroxyalkanoate synthesis repressor PhaR [Falsihalocynthiibacter arcticus]AML49954.1 polyhydroxyalkanoate biosynthesis repressor PhaR [Falsihalocynthiibacter arcticus]